MVYREIDHYGHSSSDLRLSAFAVKDCPYPPQVRVYSINCVITNRIKLLIKFNTLSETDKGSAGKQPLKG